jgi:hypothetical protein
MFVYSLEIRPYALQVLLVAAAVAGLARALADRELGRIRSPATALLRVSPIVAAAAFATYTHSTTPAFLLALTGAAAVYGIVRRESRPFWVAAALSALAALLAITPQLLVMLEVIRTNERGIAWIPSPDLNWVLVVARSLAVGEGTWNTALTGLVGGMTVGLIAWSTWRVRARPLVLVVGLVLPALGFACLAAVSLLQPVLMPRTILWMVVPLCVLVGCGVSTVAWQGFRFGILVASIVLPISLMGAVNVDSRTQDRPWSRFPAQLAHEAHATDEVVAVDKEVLCVLDYYRAMEPERKRWRLERGPGQSYRSHQRIPLGCNEAEQLSVEHLSSRLAQGIGVWLLAGDHLQQMDVEAVLEALGPSVKATHRYDWPNQTVVWRVARQ